jgi:hypothetical protein
MPQAVKVGLENVLQSFGFPHNRLIYLWKYDCGVDGAKSSDNYATSP